MYLVAVAPWISREALRAEPALWRRVRRYNLPVQLALAAAERAHPCLESPAQAALISLAPCLGGSAALNEWITKIGASAAAGTLSELRVNPTHTLHAVDNLALSDLALALGNHGYGLGLGSAPGQAWVGLELLLERDDSEALLVAGDHVFPGVQDQGFGIALGFARAARPLAALGRSLRLLGVEREAAASQPAPNAAAGLIGLWGALRDAPRGEWCYRVPDRDSDGRDAITLRWELA